MDEEFQGSLHPRAFGGHALQITRIPGHGGSAVGTQIVFCTNCRPILESELAFCVDRAARSLGGCLSQLRKIPPPLCPRGHHDCCSAGACAAKLGHDVQGPATPKQQQQIGPCAAFLSWASQFHDKRLAGGSNRWEQDVPSSMRA